MCPGAAPRPRPPLRWGLWLPTAAQERAYWREHHGHATTRHDTAFFSVFLAMHLLPRSIVPRDSQPLFIAGSVRMRRACGAGRGQGQGRGERARRGAAATC